MLVGHDDKVKLFTTLISGGRLSHAYLFFGDRGVGKRTFTEHLAHFLECGSFEATETILIDALWIAPDERGSVGIDAARSLSRFLWRTPLRSSKRLVVVDHAEALTPEAQGALLKVVEEPPPHALMIFVAGSGDALTPPLRSRLSTIYFPRLSRSAVEAALMDLRGLPRARARSIADRAFGRLGRGLQLADGGALTREGDVAQAIEAQILSLWAGERKEHAKLVRWLLDREALMRRYNLNPTLQAKAVEHQVSTRHG